MFWTCKLITLGLYFNTFMHTINSFVLLTANVDDLKKIAQKFVSDSLADKIARFIMAAADNKHDFDNNNFTRNLSEYNDEFDVEKKDMKPEYTGHFRQKLEKHKKEEYNKDNVKNSLEKTNSKTGIQKVDVKPIKKHKRQHKHKGKAVKKNLISRGQSSLEYYKSDKSKIRPNSYVDLIKIQETDESSTTETKRSQTELKNYSSYEKSDDTENNANRFNTNIHRSIENDISQANILKKDSVDNASDDFNYSNKLDVQSKESSTKKNNVTTKVERNEFDQYFNTNYPKAEVVATSGPLELTKPTKRHLSDYDIYN